MELNLGVLSAVCETVQKGKCFFSQIHPPHIDFLVFHLIPLALRYILGRKLQKNSGISIKFQNDLTPQQN